MTSNFDVPIFKTINECATFSGLAKYHIRKMLLAGKLKYIKSGNKYLVQVASLVEYLQKGDCTINKQNLGECDA